MSDLRIIPSIDELRRRAGVAAFESLHGAAATTTALRDAAAELRSSLLGSDAALAPGSSDQAASWIESRAEMLLMDRFRGSLRPLINATGVIIHTNLGRAPLCDTAVQRVQRIARGYSNLEYDLEAGRRGSRTVHAAALLTRLTGAEAALVVNNNAAATMLILASLATGREVIVSRGELVEIGGGFRVPDVMAQSGAVLREVGTTNRTRVADYVAAIGPRTSLLLRVHPSNFRIEGFTERPALADLAAAAHEAQLPLVEDLGSGLLAESIAGMDAGGSHEFAEPTVRASLEAGVDLVCFSGDKLLGGPQCGIIVGRRDLVERLQRHPLMRALRVDKLTLAALEGTLIEYLAGRAADSVPVVRMIGMSVEALEERATVLAEGLHEAGWRVSLTTGSSAIGGGSAPGVELPTVLLAIDWPGLSADALDRQLRALDPPVIARIEDDRVVLDLRTVPVSGDGLLLDLLTRGMAPTASSAG